MKAQTLVSPALALAVGVALGWLGKPAPARRLCDECGAIVAMQSRPERGRVDMVQIDNMKAELERKELGRASYRSMSGRPPDLHPDCECACHRYWLGPASRVHDGA